MMFLSCFLQLLIVSIGAAHLILSPFLKHTNVMTYLEFITFSPVMPKEEKQAACQNNDSIFVLVGNPGVIWHPKIGQCLHTKLNTHLVSGGGVLDDPGELFKPCLLPPLSVGRFFLNKSDTC
jgi:hypothetical protein